MKTIIEKIISGIVPLIPFSSLSEGLQRSAYVDEFGTHGRRKNLINLISSLITAGVIITAILHGLSAYESRNDVQKDARSYFQEFDKSKDDVLDSTEFYNFYREEIYGEKK